MDPSMSNSERLTKPYGQYCRRNLPKKCLFRVRRIDVADHPMVVRDSIRRRCLAVRVATVGKVRWDYYHRVVAVEESETKGYQRSATHRRRRLVAKFNMLAIGGESAFFEQVSVAYHV